VWDFVLNGTAVDAPRQAKIVMLDGKHVIESVVDLKDKKILRWEPVKDAHGMVLLDDFTAVQQIINDSTEFAEVLKNTASPTRKSDYHAADRRLFRR
jgi:primary-amine oxidase